MSRSRSLSFGVLATFAVVAAGCTADAANTQGGGGMASGMAMGSPITGEGIPNPAPNVTIRWGDQPEGREWGSSAGVDIDPTDGHVWAYERCSGNFGQPCVDRNDAAPIFKFDRNTGAVLANFGAGIFVTPHGIHADDEGNVWVTDFAGVEGRGHQVHKFSPDGELLLSLGVPGVAGSAPGQLNQPNDVVVGPNGNIYVGDGHSGQGMTSEAAMAEGREQGLTGRIVKFSPTGEYLMEWGEIGTLHGDFRTPHAVDFDSQGRLWVADRGNHRLEIFDQNGNYLDSRYSHGRISGIYITDDDMIYSIDSESSMTSHPNWMNGVRIASIHDDVIVGFIPPHEADSRPLQGAAGEGVAVDADGNVFAAEGPNSLRFANGGAFTKYSVGM